MYDLWIAFLETYGLANLFGWLIYKGVALVSALRDKILSADDLPKESEEIPEWGVKVDIIGMTGSERATFLTKFRNEDGTINFATMYGLMAVHVIHDPETGEKVFSPEDEPALNQKSAAVLERIAKVGMRLSGMDDDAEKREGKDSSKESNGSTSS